VNGTRGRTFASWLPLLASRQVAYRNGHTSHQQTRPDSDRVHMPRDRNQVESDQARWLGTSRPGWLVIWSPWRRTFTAFACFAPDAVVIDEMAVDRLLVAMREAEQRYAIPASVPAYASGTAAISRNYGTGAADPLSG
jgi:hypothetical protein